MTEATPFLQKYDITFLRPPPIAQRAFFEHYYNVKESSASTHICKFRMTISFVSSVT